MTSHRSQCFYLHLILWASVVRDCSKTVWIARTVATNWHGEAALSWIENWSEYRYFNFQKCHHKPHHILVSPFKVLYLPQCTRNKHPTKSKTTPFFLPCPKKSKQSHEERLLPLAEKNCQTSLVLYVRYGLQKYPKQEAKFITKADFHNVCNSCSVTLEKCPVTNLHGTPLTCFFCRPLLDTNLYAAS